MYRFLIALALVGLLGSCTTQGGGASDGVGGQSSAGASGGLSSAPSAECEESFAAIAEMGLSSMSELGDLEDDVKPTVEACESVADWIASAQQALGTEVRPGSADFLLRVQCDDLSLARTPICEELS